MARMEKLSAKESKDVLADAVARALQVTVTVQRQNRWISFQSHFIVIQGSVFWIEFPAAEPGQAPFDCVAEENVGLMFQSGSERCLFGATALRQEEYTDESGQGRWGLRMRLSGAMQRSQRRLHKREDARADWQARASFWLGGREAQPAEARVDAPIWSGRLADLSAGGLLVRVSGEAARYMDSGDIVGICLTFGAEERSIYLDAQLRHSDPDGEMALMGFQFVDLETDYAREALGVIADKLAEHG